MLKKIIIVLIGSVILSFFTYHLPYTIGQRIEVEIENNLQQPTEVIELLKKKELTKSEFEVLEKYSDAIADSVYTFNLNKENHDIRKGVLFWMSLIWLLYFICIPSRAIFYLITVLPPLIYLVLGYILSVEIGIIVSLAIIVFVVKKSIKKTKETNGVRLD